MNENQSKQDVADLKAILSQDREGVSSLLIEGQNSGYVRFVRKGSGMERRVHFVGSHITQVEILRL